MGRQIRHMSICIKGMMRNKPRTYNRFLLNEDGTTPTFKEAKAYLLEKIADGWEVLPMSKNCIGFDKVKGCPGHPVDEEQEPKQLDFVL